MPVSPEETEAAMRIGFIGLGIMGGGMAANLARAGKAPAVWNRTAERAKSLAALGARVAASAADAAKGADIVITMLSDPAAVREVAAGAGGFLPELKAGALWVNASTVDPAFAREMAALAGAQGARYLDAPVTGSKGPAAKGELIFFVGGVADDVARAGPLLDIMGRRTVHAGPVGAGSAVKLCNNLLALAGVLAFAEAIAAGESMGVDIDVLLEALTTSPVAAPLLAVKAHKLRDRDWSPEFPLHLAHKDLNLLMRTAYAANLPLPLTAAVKERFGDAKARGLGGEDITAVYEVVCPGAAGASGSDA
jgi:3-hydroxyisobutyrate dehydrogenase-like beta-hydroxyacid dehydrogenase